MRPATAHDSDRLFAWRNDPVTQAASRSTAPVPREDHDRWMQFNVINGYPQHMVMMADTETGSVGVVRFDSVREDVMAFDVSITLAPQHRGKGLAFDVLHEACGYMQDFTIRAEVRRENTASRKLFERCGFEEIGRSSGFLNYVREPKT
jgi:RimJ/RimL family protein N-acetyltransferase